MLYSIGIFHFRFLFCWCLGFFFPVPLPVKVGGGFSRSVPSLCSRVYFMYTSYFVPRAFVVSVAGFFTIVVVGAMAV